MAPRGRSDARNVLTSTVICVATRRDEALQEINLDSLVVGRPIHEKIANDAAINAAFDQITYGKGSAILSMFESWVGTEKFQRFIHDYLAHHTHGSATADDFLDELAAHAGADVAAAYRTFLDQPGVPLVSVAVRCAGKAARLELSQERFLPLGATAPQPVYAGGTGLANLAAGIVGLI